MASVSGADDSAAREAVRVETSSVVLYGDGGSKEVLQGAIHTIILNRPKARNAVDGPTAKALASAFRSFEADDNARVAVLWGAGGTFCAGADLKAIGGENMNETLPIDLEDDPTEDADGPMGPTRMVLSKPVIAAISGHAVAGGLELAVWADLRVVEEDAVMGVFCRRWGVPLIDGGTVRLPRLIGMGAAMDLILTGRAVDAKEAKAIGLATRVVPHGQARNAAEELAASIAVMPQTCMRQDRASALEQFGLSPRQALANEFTHGLTSLTHAAHGASKFAQGAGRHGAFSATHVLRDNREDSGSASGTGADDGGIKAVLFDLGGVIVDSPVAALADLEKDKGLPKHAINKAVATAGPEGAFQRFERGELDVEGFTAAMSQELEAAGISDVTGDDFFSAITSCLQPRQPMLEAIKVLREAGLKTGVLTNNFKGIETTPPYLQKIMDTIVESCKEGMRKPDPEIYLLACRRLGVHPTQVAYLDDIGYNLKPARALGMKTIRVGVRDQGGVSALAELGSLLPQALRQTMAKAVMKAASRGRL